MSSCLMHRVLPVLIALAPACAAHAGVVYADGTFLPGDWALETYQQGTMGGSAFAGQFSGGVPSPARQHTVNTGPAGNTTWAFSRYGTSLSVGRYVPASDGAITSVSYSLDFSFITGSFFGAGQGLFFALKQNNVVYVASGSYTTTGSQQNVWGSHAANALTQSDFTPVLGGSTNPDFSVAGEPIRFGWVSGNSNTSSPYFTQVAYDNFRVEIIPAPAGVASLALAGAFAIRRRRAHERRLSNA